MKTTNIDKSYWSETGAYQKEYSELFAKLVPDIGGATTLNGELLRVASNLIYEYNNNGNCNAYETTNSTEEVRCPHCRFAGEDDVCEHCEGSGIELEDAYDYSLNESYHKYFNLIATTLNNPAVNDTIDKIVSLIVSRPDIGNDKVYFKDANQALYSYLMDHVVFYCMNNEDKELPEFYKLEVHE